MFNQVKDTVQCWRDLHCKPVDYLEDTEWINLTCDTSLMGGSGVISQGNNL